MPSAPPALPPELSAVEPDDRVAVPEMSSLSGAVRAVADRIRWDDRHRRLSRHPLFAGCARQDIRKVVRSGDEIEVDAGEVLAHEDAIGYWFFVVLEGALALSRRGVGVATLGVGRHAGEVAILGFGPQPTTIAAASPTRLFVIGRRDFLSLAYNLPILQSRLFPSVRADAFTDHVRSLWAEADVAWKRLQREHSPTVALSREEALRHFRPSRRIESGSFTRLASRAFNAPPEPSPQPPVRRLSRRARVQVAAGVVALTVLTCVAGLALYHPPIVVVTPGRPFDVADDITVEGGGASLDPPNGRYLLTPVRYDQPTLWGAAVAVVTGGTTVPLEPHDDDESIAAVSEGQAVFRASRSAAADQVLRAAGLDPARVRVTFRARELQGSSAGLVYALALADMLSDEDLAAGRTIAATGAIDEDGNVVPVAFVWVKAESLKSRPADLFLVPPTQAAFASELRAEVREVKSLADAITLLRESRPAG